MESRIIGDFIKAQQALITNGGGTVATPAAKTIVRPEAARKYVDETDPEEMFNDIIEKKPAAKKILKFLQVCIDSIVTDED
jgi:shikimate kinase